MDAGQLLSYLTCPALVQLSVSFQQNVQYFKYSVTRSSCKLKTLSLATECASEIVFLSCFSLPALQPLRSLLIDGLEACSTIIKAFTFTENMNRKLVVMPFLETITLRMGQVPDDLVSDTISSCMRGIPSNMVPHALKAAHVRFLHRLERFSEGYCSGEVAQIRPEKV